MHDRTGAHDLFISKLDEYILNRRFVQGFQIQMMKFIESSTKSQSNENDRIKNQLAGLEKKRDNLQENYYLDNDPPKPVYEKLMNKIETEMVALRDNFGNLKWIYLTWTKTLKWRWSFHRIRVDIGSLLLSEGRRLFSNWCFPMVCWQMLKTGNNF